MCVGAVELVAVPGRQVSRFVDWADCSALPEWRLGRTKHYVPDPVGTDRRSSQATPALPGKPPTIVF